MGKMGTKKKEIEVTPRHWRKRRRAATHDSERHRIGHGAQLGREARERACEPCRRRRLLSTLGGAARALFSTRAVRCGSARSGSCRLVCRRSGSCRLACRFRLALCLRVDRRLVRRGAREVVSQV